MRKTCGSEPARDSGFSVNITIECYALIASKLAPTLDLYKSIKNAPYRLIRGISVGAQGPLVTGLAAA
jgi:hypothetical protein